MKNKYKGFDVDKFNMKKPYKGFDVDISLI